MPVVPTTQDHVLEAVVAGPDGANRLYTCTGVAQAYMYVAGNANSATVQTFTFPVGPKVGRRQFIRAIATANADLQVNAGATPMGVSFRINSVEADWDDEGETAEVRVEVSASAAGAQTYATLLQLRYWATILAEV